MARWRVLTAAVAVAVVVPGCGDDDDDAGGTVATGVTLAIAPTMPVSPTTPAAPTTTTTPTTTTIVTTTTTTVAPTTTLPGLAGLAADAVSITELGRSVEGRPIAAVERGTPGGTRVLVIGVIHGDEADGVAILERLASAAVPAGVDLWLIESMNPDGQAAQRRGNVNGVDLNRNFPFDWGPIAEPGDDEYAGTGPASEPETRAIVDFVGQLTPALVVWYHQDLFRLSPGQGLEGALKQRYAELTGLPIERITGGTYTGVAATWVRNTTEAISFIVELGPALTPQEADAHAAAVLEIAAMVAAE